MPHQPYAPARRSDVVGRLDTTVRFRRDGRKHAVPSRRRGVTALSKKRLVIDGVIGAPLCVSRSTMVDSRSRMLLEIADVVSQSLLRAEGC